MTKNLNAIEFGDFQTPKNLAKRICQNLFDAGLQPASLIEPTCGIGNILFAALDRFPSLQSAIGADISTDYIKAAQSQLSMRDDAFTTKIIREDFFDADWPSLIRELPDPLLVIGNPPWVTNSQLGALKSDNLPEKSNFQGYDGFDAMTGKSNFDISESMLIQTLHWLNDREATLAMLCKTDVARKILAYAWKREMNLSDASIYRINANLEFNASVDACLLFCRFSKARVSRECRMYRDLECDEIESVIAYRDGLMVSSLDLYERWKRLRSLKPISWRSGIKHDCAKVMELTENAESRVNGLNETVDIEEECLYPMLKSSDLASGDSKPRRKWMLVTQRSVQDDTNRLREIAPKTWRYLESHSDLLMARASSIYRNRTPFSIFGVGDYSFSPWKVGISGLYKRLTFAKIGPRSGKPVVLDDTCYFLPCRSEAEADTLVGALNSDPAQEFYRSFVFWDKKRPVTVDLLQRLDLEALARELGVPFQFNSHQSRGYSQPSLL